MSEPTYRVDIQHRPIDLYHWRAVVVRLSDGKELLGEWGDTREEAFERAQEAVRGFVTPESPSSVFLTEDGDIIDRHEAGVLRDANA